MPRCTHERCDFARITIIRSMLVLAFAMSGRSVADGPVSEAAGPQPVLTSLAGLAQYYGRKDISSVPIECEVWVNYWDHRDQQVFVQDAHDACYVDVASDVFELHPRLEPGTRVRIVGQLLLDGHYLSAESVEVTNDLSDAGSKSVVIDELSVGDWWSYRIKTRGGLVEVAHLGHQWLALASSRGTEFVIHRFDENEKDYDWPLLIGRDIRIRGTLSCELDYRGHPFRYCVRTNEHDNKLRLERQDEADYVRSRRGQENDGMGQQLGQAVEASLERLRSFDASSESLYRISGQITSVVANNGFLIEAGGHGVFVRSGLARKTYLGHIVELTVRRTGANTFQAVTLYSKAFRSIPPAPLYDGRAIDVTALPHRATIEADFVSSRSHGDKRLVALREGDTEFVAVLDTDLRSWRSASLDNARRMSVTGMVVPIQEDVVGPMNVSELAFAIELRGIEDMQVISRWWQFSPTSAITGLALFSAICSVGMICFAGLWFKVQRADRTNRRLTSQLVQSQKMDALGRLAGGVAHDFNNLLAGIGSNLELIDHDVGCPDSQREQCLASARRCTMQATKLVRSLLSFSRQGTLEFKVGNINNVVEEAALLARSSLGPDVEIALDLDPDLPSCRFDQVQLEQVFLNLCFNARDAFHLHSGTIHIDTACVSDAQGNRVVKIRVRDFGKGMPEETATRVFDPFFTTKPVGKGTGLGLAIAYGIVKQHEGSIECESELGVGSVFTINLPALGKEPAPETGRIHGAHDDVCIPQAAVAPRSDIALADAALVDAATGGSASDPEASDPEASHPEASAIQRGQIGSWNVLLIDDDAEVRRIARLSLEALGHHVTDVASGHDAIRMIGRGFQSDVVVLDLVMPGLSGNNTFCQLKSMRPDLPIIVCSGLTTEIEKLRRLSGRHPDAILSKPFQLADLQKSLAQVTLHKNRMNRAYR